MQDTHLQNLFLTDDGIKSKTAIVTQTNPSLAITENLGSFGQVFSVGLDGVAALLPNKPIAIELPRTVPDCLREVVFERSITPHDATDVDSLLMKGKQSSELINAQLVRQQNPPYFVQRAKDVFDRIHGLKGHRIVIAHSDIGNGKTLFAAELAARLKAAAFRVFDFRPE